MMGSSEQLEEQVSEAVSKALLAMTRHDNEALGRIVADLPGDLLIVTAAARANALAATSRGHDSGEVAALLQELRDLAARQGDEKGVVATDILLAGAVADKSAFEQALRRVNDNNGPGVLSRLLDHGVRFAEDEARLRGVEVLEVLGAPAAYEGGSLTTEGQEYVIPPEVVPWLELSDEEQKRRLLEAFARVRTLSPGGFSRRKKDEHKQAIKVAWELVAFQEWAFIADLASRSLKLVTEGKAPRRVATFGEREVLLLWGVFFSNIDGALEDAYRSQRMSAEDCFYRSYIVCERFYTFAARHLDSRGWDEDFLQAAEDLRDRQIRLALITPARTPMPEA